MLESCAAEQVSSYFSAVFKYMEEQNTQVCTFIVMATLQTCTVVIKQLNIVLLAGAVSFCPQLSLAVLLVSSSLGEALP